jgi:hypothetical protein
MLPGWLCPCVCPAGGRSHFFTTTLRPWFSVSTGFARAVSVISPKAFFASRADMVFTIEFRSIFNRVI